MAVGGDTATTSIARCRSQHPLEDSPVEGGEHGTLSLTDLEGRAATKGIAATPARREARRRDTSLEAPVGAVYRGSWVRRGELQRRRHQAHRLAHGQTCRQSQTTTPESQCTRDHTRG